MGRSSPARWRRHELGRFLDAALVQAVLRDHRQSDRAFRRRRAVAAVTLVVARFASLAVVAVITLVNGLAEELFFRGALYAAVGVRFPVLISTALYCLTILQRASCPR